MILKSTKVGFHVGVKIRLFHNKFKVVVQLNITLYMFLIVSLFKMRIIKSNKRWEQRIRGVIRLNRITRSLETRQIRSCCLTAAVALQLSAAAGLQASADRCRPPLTKGWNCMQWFPGWGSTELLAFFTYQHENSAVLQAICLVASLFCEFMSCLYFKIWLSVQVTPRG